MYSNAPSGKCLGCGYEGRDKSFRYVRYCSKCYKKWKKERAVERKKMKPLNENIEVLEGFIVTRNVRKRLSEIAERNIPHSRLYIFLIKYEILFAFIPVLLNLILALLGARVPGILWGISCFFFIVILSITEKMIRSEVTKRGPKVKLCLEQLVRERKKRIDETLVFYGSPEWRLIRKDIIHEQGDICQECNNIIKEDYDLTVDHIKPRSKYPKLALEKTNLRVLCRSCNSRKGSFYEEATAIINGNTK